MERRDPSVDLGALAVLPDLGVHVEGEVDRGSPLGEPLHVALRREDEDLVLVEVDLEELEKLFRVMGLLLELEQLPEPAEVLVQLVGTLLGGLVEPVGRDAVLRGPVHLLGPDLDLVELAVGSEDRGVERLVPVRLGARDVVLEALLEGQPLVMDHAQGVVAVGHGADDDPERHHVVDVVEPGIAAAHLLEDGPEVLGPAAHLELGDPGAPQFLLERLLERLHHRLTLGPLGGDLAGERGVILRLQELEGEVFELRLDAGHPEAVREGSVDLPGLGRDAGALLRGEMLQGPHVVEPVGQLDDDDPGVLRDREQQFPVVLDLLFGGRAEGEVGDLGQAFHQLGHLGAEFTGDVFDLYVGILHHVVEQRGRDRGGIEELTDQDGGDRDAVGDELLPAHPLLAPVGARAEAEGPVDQVEIEPVGMLVEGGAKFGSDLESDFAHRRPWLAKLVKRSPATIT